MQRGEGFDPATISMGLFGMPLDQASSELQRLGAASEHRLVQADCSYHCMQAIESSRQFQGLSSRKYHGKWPFTRVLGMQELFSVLMSLGNLVVHLLGSAMFVKGRRSQAFDHYGTAWLCYVGVSMFAWVASAIFHSRDTDLTEKLDYMAAFATVVTGFALSVIRCFGLSKAVWQVSTGTVCGIMWGSHMYYMLKIKFDYGWNMKICVSLGLIQAFMWIIWSQLSRHPARQLLLTFVVAVNGAMLFEIMDFTPIFGLIDAHSIWHALTVAITPLWYRFMIIDTDYLSQAGSSKAQ